MDQPAKDSWSLGQVYTHLLSETAEYNFQQIEICISGDQHSTSKKSEEGESIFAQNSFPDTKLKSPVAEAPDQPVSVEQLKRELQGIRQEIDRLEKRIAASPYHGKAKHPGLHYLDAWEWMQFIDIHYRHHLRQKKRIDEYLGM